MISLERCKQNSEGVTIPAGSTALESIISAARSVFRMLVFGGPGALLNRDILAASAGKRVKLI